MTEEVKKPKLEIVSGEEMSIPKPGKFDLGMFKTGGESSAANVGTLLSALPHHNIAAAKDFVRLHPNEDTHWSDELFFVNVPIKGQKQNTLT
jgi:hypothetical protein